MTISELKAIYKKWLYLEQDDIIDVIFATCICNLVDGTAPVNLHVVGASGGGKTALVDSLSGFPKTRSFSKMTPQTFLSGWKGSKGEPSVLKQMEAAGQKIMLFKEFTSVLNMRDDFCREVLGQFRELADMKVTRDTGQGADLGWEGKIGIITCTTSFIDKFQQENNQLGERFLFYRTFTKDQRKLTRAAQRNAIILTRVQQELKEAACAFLTEHDKAEYPAIQMPDDILDQIASIAEVAAITRSAVARSKYDKTLDYIPEKENATRLVQQLTNLAMGLATVQHKKSLDEGVVEIIRTVAMGSMHSIRNRIIQTMWKRQIVGDEWTLMTTVNDFCRIHGATFNRFVEDLVMLEVIDKRKTGISQEIVLNPEFAKSIAGSGIFDGLERIPIVHEEDNDIGFVDNGEDEPWTE